MKGGDLMKVVYRVVNALLAALVFPATFFLELIFIKVSFNDSLTGISDLVAKFLPDASKNPLNYGIKESINLKRVIDIVRGNDRLSPLLSDNGEFTWPEALDRIKPHLIACAVLLGVALLTALFILIWSACSNRRLPPVIAAAVGICAAVAMIIVFNRAAAHVMNGDLNLIEIFAGAGIMSSVLGEAIQVDSLVLGGFQNAIIILLALVIVWTVIFVAIEWGDAEAEAEKAARKAQKQKRHKKKA